MSQNDTQDNKTSELDSVELKDGRDADLSISSRDKVRKQLEDEVEAFLAKGGQIDQVAPNVTADPPQKPQNNYCSRPI
ncbi:hypothetical protein R50073_48030 [Maricurvus nonylphenolicus]|uniref:hypothetical protein n=1 Tax=Maricurvus nonylphenolicus TaxID=1008307 RepID=UPI0036F35E0D